MKFRIFLLLLLPTILWGFIEDLQYEATIDRGVQYDATVLEHNNRLYVDAEGGVEEYQITEDGSLEFISHLPKSNHTLASARIYDNTLYVIDAIGSDYSQEKLYRIDLSGAQMELIDETELISNYGVNKFQVTEDYFIYTSYSQTMAKVLDRNTLEFVTELATSSFYYIEDDYLFVSMTNGEAGTLEIMDISDIFNPTFVDSVELGAYQQNRSFLLEDDILYIGQNESIVLVDFSDPSNAEVLATISDIPNNSGPCHYVDIALYEDYLIFKNDSNYLWVYDVSNPESPQFLYFDLLTSIASNYLPSMEIFNNNLYLTSSGSNILQIDCQQLPELVVIDDFGTNTSFRSIDYHAPFIFYSNYLNKSIHYLNTLETATEPILLSEQYASLSFSLNDEWISFIRYVNVNSKELVICSYDNETITEVYAMPLGYYNYRTAFVGNTLIVASKNPAQVKMYQIDEFGVPELLATHDTYLHPVIVQLRQACSDDYIYINSYDQNLTNYINIYENDNNYEEVDFFELNQFNQNMVKLQFLGDEQALLSTSAGYNYRIYLSAYEFPHEFEQLDYQQSSGYFKMREDYLFWSENNENIAKLFTVESNQIEEIFSYDFGHEIDDIWLVPETNMLYAVGRYNVLKYSFEYSDTAESSIPLPQPTLTNYPNPFRPAAGGSRSASTTINFALPEAGEAEVIIYNLKGQKIKTLLSEQLLAGEHSVTWNGRNERGQAVASGVYLYQLQVDGQSLARQKMMLVK